MKKLALLLALAVVAVPAMAQEKKEAKPAEKTAAAPAKTHEVTAEVVSVDATAKTITIKGEAGNKTVPVDEKAIAQVKELKAGQPATLICRDDEKGAHQAVAGVKVAATMSGRWRTTHSYASSGSKIASGGVSDIRAASRNTNTAAIATRSSGVSPRPNSCWNTLRGLCSMGSGVDGVRNEIVLP